MAGSRTIRVLAALAMAMTIGTLAMKLFENASPLPMTQADLMALSPKTDFKTLVPEAEWKHIVIFALPDANASADPAAVAHFILDLDARNGRPIVTTTDLWRRQTATPADKGNLACIAIGLKGDFSRKAPTSAQMDELTNLVCLLQYTRNVGPQNVRLHNPGDAFPTEKFTAKLLK